MQISVRTVLVAVACVAFVIATIQARLELKSQREQFEETLKYYGLGRIHEEDRYEFVTYRDSLDPTCVTHLVRVGNAIDYNLVVVYFDGATQRELRKVIPLKCPEFVISYTSRAPNEFSLQPTTIDDPRFNVQNVEFDGEERFWFSPDGAFNCPIEDEPFLYYFFCEPDVEGASKPVSDRSAKNLKSKCKKFKIKSVYFSFEQKR